LESSSISPVSDFLHKHFPHKQNGCYYEGLAELAKAQAFISSKVDEFIAKDHPN